MGDKILPPLPKTIKEYSISQTDSIALPALQDMDVADEILQNHLLRVQEAILSSTDQKVATLNSSLKQHQQILKKVEDEKQISLVELYKTRKEVGTLNKALALAKKKVEQYAGETMAIHQEWQAVERESQDLNSELQELRDKLKVSQKRVEDSETKIKQLHEINTNYTSEIKIQKRINLKLKQEIDYSNTKLKDLESVLEKEKEKNELLHHSKKNLESLFTQQQAEVLKSQNAISVLNEEVRELNRVKAATEKQWEEALTAMSNRDKTIQAVVQNKEKIETKLHETKLIKDAYKKEQSELEKTLQKKELEIEDLKRQNELLSTSVNQLQTNHDASQGIINQYQYSETGFKKDIESLKKARESLERQVSKKNEEIGTLKKELQSLHDTNKETMRYQISADQVYRREEELQQTAKKEIDDVKRDGDSKNFELRRENATLKLELNKREQEIYELQRNHSSLKQQHQEISDHYAKLHEEAKQMIYTLERKEYDLNQFKSKTSAQAEDHKEVFSNVISGLKTELECIKAEKDRLQSLWLESQKELVTEQNKYAKLLDENELLNTKLGIAEGVRSKIDIGLEEVKEESFEHKKEAAKLYNELKRLQPIIKCLQEKNRVLEHQLHEANLKVEETHVDHQTTKQLLRTEIRRLSQDKSALKQEMSNYGKSIMHVEKDTQLHKEMIDKLKSERYELQRQVYQLKRRADEAERKYFDATLKVRQNEKVDAKKAIQQQTSNQNKPKKDTKTDFQEQVPEAQPKEGGNHKIQDLPDFEAWRLKLETLTNEKEFLMNENTILKQKLNQHTKAIKELQEHVKLAQIEIKQHQQNEKETQEKIITLDLRYARAKKVAAHIEKQFKEMKPNSKIDYQMIGDTEPSTQLLAAILAKDIKK